MEASFLKIPSIILVDDHIVFRQGLKSLLTFEKIGTVIGEASNGIDFLNLLTPPIPDVVLLDVNMLKMNGVIAAQKALERLPDLKIIIVSMSGNLDFCRKLFDLGVKGYLLKSSGFSEFRLAIQEVSSGATFLSSNLKERSDFLRESQMICNVEEEYHAPLTWW